jgi:hypothetical protein
VNTLPTCHADLALTSRAKLFSALGPQRHSLRHNLYEYNSESVANNDFRFIFVIFITREYALKLFPERIMPRVNMLGTLEKFSFYNKQQFKILETWYTF